MNRRLSDHFMQLGVIAGATGMLLGVWMGSNEDFTLAPVHAHINLLGWVSMLLYGLVYRVVPKATVGRLPILHFFLNVLSFLTLVPSLTLFLLGNKEMGPLLGIASIAMFTSMLLFVLIILRATWREDSTASATSSTAL